MIDSIEITKLQNVTPLHSTKYAKFGRWLINAFKLTFGEPRHKTILKISLIVLAVLAALVLALPTLSLSLIFPLYCLYQGSRVTKIYHARVDSPKEFQIDLEKFLDTAQRVVLTQTTPPKNAFEWFIVDFEQEVIPRIDKGLVKEDLEYLQWMLETEESIIPYLAYPEDPKIMGSCLGINILLSEIFSNTSKYVFLDPEGNYSANSKNKIAYTSCIFPWNNTHSIEGVYNYVKNLLTLELEKNQGSRPSKIFIPITVRNPQESSAHQIFLLVELYSKDKTRADFTVVNTHGDRFIGWYTNHEKSILKAAQEVYSSKNTRVTSNECCCYSNSYSCVADALFIGKKLLDNPQMHVHDAVKNKILKNWKLPHNYRYLLGELSRKFITSFMNQQNRPGVSYSANLLKFI